MAALHAGYETVMVNCNPERCPPTTTRPARLYFDPLDLR